LRSPHLLADLAVVDAELGVDVPREVTARTGMDALCQLIESYTSNRAQPITDALALEGIRRAAKALPRVFSNGQDLQAREDMALAALLSGQTLANVGLGAVHGFAAPLGANLPVPHGTLCAVLLPHVMAANVETLSQQFPEHDVLRRYAVIGRTLVGAPDLPDTVAIDQGIQFTAELVETLQIPRLREFGLVPDQAPELVQLARKSSSMRYNPVVLAEDRLQEVLMSAW
jgi:alcohol dehydrogenase class IV